MTWATFLLTLISAYVAIKLIGLTSSKGRLKFLGLTIAAVIITLLQLSLVIETMADSSNISRITSFVVEWGHVISLAFVLSSLAVFIRESKPVFAQFPIFYTAFPLLIIISYMLVQDTYALKRWLIAIYQGGAIIVSLLMYSVYAYRRKKYATVLAGIILFCISYLLYWCIPGIDGSLQWIWELAVGSAMIVTVHGYEQAEPQLTDQNNPI